MLNYLKVTLKNSSYRFNYKRFELSLGVKIFFFLNSRLYSRSEIYRKSPG